MPVLPNCLHLPSRRPVAVPSRPPCASPASPVGLGRQGRPATIIPQGAETAANRRHAFGRCHATSADPQQQEVESMDDAQKRWGQQVREGKVKSLTTKSAGDMLKNDWTLLDVRPKHEVDVASIQGAVNVPLFVVDEELSPGTFAKKAMAFGAMGGWWEGGTHMIPNQDFMAEVQRKVPKDRKVIVACQKGLRSLAASEQLSKAGYQNLAWINGGLQTATKGDLPVKGEEDIRMAGIGGLSALLGWTEVQQQSGKGFMGGSNNLLRVAIAVLVLDGAWFLYDQAQYFLSKR